MELLIGLGVGVVMFLILLASMVYTVDQQTEAVIERFGKFERTAQAGLNFKLPFIEGVRIMDTRVTQLDVPVETKTKDNVFVTLKVSIQYQVSDIKSAAYKLSNTKGQISSYVFDVVRAQVPKLTLDESFEKKDDVAKAIKEELTDAMAEFGYSIVKTLVVDIEPDAKVKAAMNEINAATRTREATTQKAEAEKMLMVKRAEGESESKALQGQGIARERKAIIEGLKDSVDAMKEATGASAADVMGLILMTQYFDTLKSLGEKGATTILMPHQPGAVSDLQSQLLTAFAASEKKAK